MAKQPGPYYSYNDPYYYEFEKANGELYDILSNNYSNKNK